MATKKQIPVKKGKTVKPAAKKVIKTVKKPVPAKKSASAKKATPKKAATKKPIAKKQIAKKSVRKAVVKKSVKKILNPIKKVQKKAILAKKAPKPVIKAAPKKSEKKPVIKKIEVKKSILNPIFIKKSSKKIIVKLKEKSPQKAKDIKIVPAKPVVLPKINTKTSRKYQPEFTKSVLDKPKHDLGAPLVRYNDTDLNEFREIIQRKLESAKKELSYLQGLITRKDEMGGDNDDARYMTMEDGSMSMEREQLSTMANRQNTFIDHLEKAVMRIENKTYGICRVTGQLIDKARLRAVPHATLSIEAKMGSSK